MPFLYEHMNFAPFQKMAAVVRFKEHTTSMQDGCRKSALQVAMLIFCPFILKRFFYVHLYHACLNGLNFILKEDKTPTFIGASCDKLVLVEIQSHSKIKPPADNRGVLDFDA